MKHTLEILGPKHSWPETSRYVGTLKKGRIAHPPGVPGVPWSTWYTMVSPQHLRYQSAPPWCVPHCIGTFYALYNSVHI